MPSPTDPDSWSQVPMHLQGEIRALPRDYHQPHISEILPPDPRLYVYHAGPSMYSFSEMRAQIVAALLRTTPFNRGAWQTLNVSQSDQHDTHELRNVHVFYNVPETAEELEGDVQPNYPWAEAHFQERVGGKPLNPAPSYKIWPHHNGTADRHVEDQVFSHTYPERFWPRFANEGETRPNGRRVYVPHNGVRFEYGDLHDVVGQLHANPLTRQAVLPVWFPEDTGATDRRVPCTLFYHFMADGDGRLDCWYTMRACDFARHFHNDVYLAARLLQWVCDQLAFREGPDDHIVPEKSLMPGHLNMTISNLHLFRGDAEKLS
jgi:hypothetical protein